MFSVNEYQWPAFQGRKPFDHQKVTTAFLIKNKRGYVLNDMGTGKTLAALWACDLLMQAGKLRRALIVGPVNTMRSVWYNEIQLNMPHRSVTIAHGSRADRIKALKSQSNFVIINHDGVKVIEDEIIDQQFGVIIIDELTAFKSHSSDRSKVMKNICDHQDLKKNKLRISEGGVWGMTGEITPNNPTEAWMQCRIVNPNNEWLPRFFGQFRDACTIKINEYMSVPKPEAPQIVSMCASPSIRFTREQCLDLPPTMTQDIQIPLSDEQSKYYKQMAALLYAEHESGSISAANAAVKLNKLCQISAGAVKDDEGQIVEIGCEDRIQALLDLFYQTPQRKLVVFATYRATIEMLVRRLSEEGIKCQAIHGDVGISKRPAIISAFQTGDLEILILQPQSTAHGITLTASSTIVWFSLVASNELFNQGNARIVRAGQTRTTWIYLFISTPAERHLAQILRSKAEVSNETMGLFAGHKL